MSKITANITGVSLCQKTGTIDLAVLSRICHALDCRVEDILEYIPPQ